MSVPRTRPRLDRKQAGVDTRFGLSGPRSNTPRADREAGDCGQGGDTGRNCSRHAGAGHACNRGGRPHLIPQSCRHGEHREHPEPARLGDRLARPGWGDPDSARAWAGPPLPILPAGPDERQPAASAVAGRSGPDRPLSPAAARITTRVVRTITHEGFGSRLRITAGNRRLCDGLSRREVLRVGGAGLLFCEYLPMVAHQRSRDDHGNDAKSMMKGNVGLRFKRSFVSAVTISQPSRSASAT